VGLLVCRDGYKLEPTNGVGDDLGGGGESLEGGNLFLFDRTFVGDGVRDRHESRSRSHPKVVHREERDMKVILQARHTWPNVIKSSSSSSISKESGTIMRTLGGIRLIGASPFFNHRVKRGP